MSCRNKHDFCLAANSFVTKAPGIFKRWYLYLSLLNILSRKNCSGERIVVGKEHYNHPPQSCSRLIHNVTCTEKSLVFHLSFSKGL